MLGMLVGGIAVWIATTTEDRLIWLSVHGLGALLWAATRSDVAGPAVLAWPLVSLAIAIPSVSLGERMQQDHGLPYLLALAALSLAGIPGTLGFAQVTTRGGLLRMSPTQLPLGVLVLVGNSLVAGALLATVLQSWHRRKENAPTWHTVGLAVAAAMVGLPMLVLGLVPQLLAGLVGTEFGADLTSSLRTMVRGAGLVTWVEVLLPVGAGGLLAWRREALLRAWRAGWNSVQRVISLQWLHAGVVRLLAQAIGLLRSVGIVAEGEGYLGWLAMALLLGWLLWTL
jgi:hypothetical protein